MSQISHSPLITYAYDATDRQANHTPIGQTAIQQFYCNDHLNIEIQGEAQRRIVRHESHLLAQKRCEGLKNCIALLATDNKQSVLEALDATRSRAFAYTPYGYHMAAALPGFNGECPDPVTQCYHLGHGYRQFNAVLQRFNGPDTESPFGRGGLNVYAYCRGNPIKYSDPTGRFPVLSILSLAGIAMASVGIVGTAATMFIEDIPDEVKFGFLAMAVTGFAVAGGTIVISRRLNGPGIRQRANPAEVIYTPSSGRRSPLPDPPPSYDELFGTATVNGPLSPSGNVRTAPTLRRESVLGPPPPFGSIVHNSRRGSLPPSLGRVGPTATEIRAWRQ